MKFVSIDKMTKKQQKEYYAKHRVVNGFNTGTRDMKSNKDYSRAEEKKLCRQFLQKSE